MEKKESVHVANEGHKLFSAFTDYSLGIFISIVLGVMWSKVYQTWAIVYRESQFDNNQPITWMEDSPPTWITATESPNSFLTGVIFFFVIVGIIFTFCLRKRFKVTTR
ncbi:hypothetical protein KHA96_08585 [Bacillus sp. FJAT-49711]|uniref:hypothetical protein n=1 Tax=Bacillus sp. FJAT-49711 TaxID=2833585 RepID=UPI001BC8F318|nr:hypothetical protein [Bacillus sp. FJAT-49711]MBS4218366.1 hypothetical protein [Bacillus sp. FJAT-49711]